MSKPKAEVKWFHDGKEITPSKNVQIKADEKTRTLTLKRAAKSDTGEYTCDCGSDKTTAKLNIEGMGLTHTIHQSLQVAHYVTLTQLVFL